MSRSTIADIVFRRELNIAGLAFLDESPFRIVESYIPLYRFDLGGGEEIVLVVPSQVRIAKLIEIGERVYRSDYGQFAQMLECVAAEQVLMYQSVTWYLNPPMNPWETWVKFEDFVASINAH